MTELETYIHSYFGIQDTHMAALVDLFKEKQLKKGEFYVTKCIINKTTIISHDCACKGGYDNGRHVPTFHLPNYTYLES